MNTRKQILSCLVVTMALSIWCIDLSAQEKKIALLYPQFTISLPGENSSWLTENFYRWELFLIQNKYSYEVINDDDLEDGISNEYSLLILPAPKCLSDKEISSIKEFMDVGNSILSTFSVGVFELDGKWKGWENLEQLFGVSFVSEISQREISRIHTILGGTPLSPNIPPGFRLQITTFDKPIEVRIKSKQTFPLGYWQNSNVPFEGKNMFDNTTSAIFGKYGKGNFVWFGYEFSAVVGAKDHQKISNQVLINTVNWLTGDLSVQLGTWPNGKQAAAVLSCDVEFKFNFINNALDLLEQENMRAQFYILTESIDSLSFKRLKKIGDIGLHGDDHVLFKWQDYHTQLNRLSNGVDTLEKLTGKKLVAFRPPETLYDNITLEAMKALNVNVLSSDLIEDRAVPQFFKSQPELLLIPKTGFDDFDIFHRLKIENIDEQANKYVLDFTRTYEEGGLYSLNFHTQMQCRKEFIDALIKPIKEMKAKDVWITTHDLVYNWWVKKSKLELFSKIISENNYLVELVNSGEDQIDDVTIIFYNKNLTEFSSLKVTLGGKNLDFLTDFSAKKIKLLIPSIYPNETKQVTISF